MHPMKPRNTRQGKQYNITKFTRENKQTWSNIMKDVTSSNIIFFLMQHQLVLKQII